jgi:hypothetical protein
MCFDKSVTTFLNNYLSLSHMLLMLELLIEIKIYDFYISCMQIAFFKSFAPDSKACSKETCSQE